MNQPSNDYTWDTVPLNGLCNPTATVFLVLNNHTQSGTNTKPFRYLVPIPILYDIPNEFDVSGVLFGFHVKLY